MDTNNENSEEAKSKIEKIRIDLEKKLAALEAAKINSEKLKNSNNETLNENDGIVKETTPIVPVENTKKISSNIDSENQKFIEQISKINESSKFVNKDNNLLAEESTFFELNDEIKNVNENGINNSKEKIVIGNVTPVIPNIPKEKTQNTVATAVPQKKPIVVENAENKTINKVNVVQSKVKEIPKETIIENTNIEEDKQKEKSNLNAVIYVLGGVILIALIYLSWSFLGNSSSNDSGKNRILSEYENRRYKDSIELADANNLLLDYESQRYVDSIALANQISIQSRNAFANNSLRDRGNTTPNTNRIIPVNTVVDDANSTNVNEIVNDNDASDNIDNIENVDVVVNNDENTDNNTDATNDLVNTDNTKEESNSNSDETNNIEEIKKPIKKTETLTTIEKSPVYPGCEKSTSEKSKKRCFISKISKFVSNRFNSDLSQDLGLESGIKRINVSFVIDKSGNVNVLKVRAQHKVLEKEALRVVNALPKMKAGKKAGKSEPVYYNLPIVYKVE